MGGFCSRPFLPVPHSFLLPHPPPAARERPPGAPRQAGPGLQLPARLGFAPGAPAASSPCARTLSWVGGSGNPLDPQKSLTLKSQGEWAPRDCARRGGIRAGLGTVDPDLSPCPSRLAENLEPAVLCSVAPGFRLSPGFRDPLRGRTGQLSHLISPPPLSMGTAAFSGVPLLAGRTKWGSGWRVQN